MTGHLTDTGTPHRLDGVIADAGLRAAVGYWDRLRGPRVLPARMDLDPGALRPHLQDAAILEVARAGSVRIRLGGGRISALLGMDVRGLPLRSLFDLSERARVSAAVEEAIGDATVLILNAISPAPRFAVAPAQSLSTQIAILPMTDADLAPTRALYVMSTVDGDAKPSDAPHRWFVKEMHRLPLRAGVPVLRHPPILRRNTIAPVPATDETASETRGAMARARFRVIEGGLS